MRKLTRSGTETIQQSKYDNAGGVFYTEQRKDEYSGGQAHE